MALRYQLIRFGLAVGLITLTAVPVVAQAATSRRDCDTNAMMYCGALTQTELLKKFDSGDGKHSASALHTMYARFGVTRAAMASGDLVEGTLTKSGDVIVNGKTVATDAVSWGRQPISGSTKDGSLYKSPDQTAFLSNSIDAFIYMPGGKFKWAVLEPCGNVAQATPVVTTVTKPKPTPTPTPITTVSTPPQPALPDTGAEAPLLGSGGLAIVSAAGWAYRRSRRDLLAGLRRTS